MITFTDAWRRATIHPNGTMTILAHKTSSIGWTVVAPAPTRIMHVDATTLEFQPAGAHQVAALANLGHQLLQEIDAYRPGFLWTTSPAEIVGALIEEIAAPATGVSLVQPVPDGWCQFIDGVQTQNVARGPKELDTLKWIAKTMAPIGAKAEYRPFYFATTMSHGNVSDAARDVIAERNRQITVEGYDLQHDDAHRNDEIAAYATFYTMPPAVRDWPAEETGYGATWGDAIIPVGWWPPKPCDRRQQLVKAAALLVAEIERLDRADKAEGK